VVIHFKRSALALALLAAAGLGSTGSARAYGLIQAYQDALQHDSTYRSAKYENDAGQANKALGLAGLLPSVSANYSNSRNHLDSKDRRSQFPATNQDYSSIQSSVNLRQSIINFDAISRYYQGNAQARSSDALLQSRHQEMMVRLISAYVEVLFSSEQVNLAQAQRDTLLEQKRVNERLFAKGEGTKTDVLETQARLDLAEAQVVEARDSQAVSRAALAAIVGHEIGQIDGLGADFKVMPLQPADFSGWKALTMDNNPELKAQFHAVEVARQEVNRNRAGHYPRLDLVAGYSNTTSESTNQINQENKNRSVGIQLSIPLFAGGSVSAGTNQATSSYLRAKADQDVRSDRILNDLQRQYNTVVGSIARLDALGKAVDSARLLITATQQSIKGGVRINLDLLNARQQFYTAQRDLAQARYNYLQAYMRLRAAAGVLAPTDINKLAGYFVAKK
jgi:protease secretion system outer membrane protein